MQKAREAAAAGFNVLVCDPLWAEWPCTWQTGSREEFVAVAKRSRRCALFIDEGGQTIKRDPEAEWLFTTARHWGHLTCVLVQGATQLLPIMRAQCSRLYLFGGQSPKSVEPWAEEFNAPGLFAVCRDDFPRFNFLIAARGQPLRRGIVATAKLPSATVAAGPLPSPTTGDNRPASPG